MAIGAALAGGAIASQLYGMYEGKKAREEAAEAERRAQEAALAQLAGLAPPSMADLQYLPEEIAYVGNYDPILQEQIAELGPTAFEEISTDPRLAAAQMEALEQYGQLAEGGLSEADMAALQLSKRRAGAQAQAQQEQILQNMQQRGIAGSGAELIARLKGAQSSADRLAQQDMEIQQMAQQRALQALAGQAGLASKVRGQEFGEQSDVARAKDVISRFNTQQEAARLAGNIAEQRAAALRDANLRQQLEGSNVSLRNQAALRQANLPQQMYENQAGLAQARSGVYSGQAQRAADTGASMATGAAQQAGGMGQTLIGAAQFFDKSGSGNTVDSERKE